MKMLRNLPTLIANFAGHWAGLKGLSHEARCTAASSKRVPPQPDVGLETVTVDAEAGNIK